MLDGVVLGRLRNLLRQGRAGPVMPGSQRILPDLQEKVLLLQDYEASGLGWFWASDAEGRLTYVSGCVGKVLGQDPQRLIGEPLTSLFILEHENDDLVERALPLLLAERETFADLHVRAALEDREIWWSISGRPQFVGAGLFTGFRGNGTDVTAARRSHRDASRLAQYDSLTGLANRHRMDKRLHAALAACQATGRSCALLMVDLDRFKAVNDTLGHPAGDELLKQVAGRLQRVVTEPGCEIGRLGGDEFQVMIPDLDDRGRLGEVARTIITKISQPYQIESSRCVIGASVGVAVFPFDGLGCEDLVRSADLALYAAKGGGRGQFRFYSRELHSEAERRRQIEEDLREALRNDQLHLVYQPIVDTQTNQVVSLEALARWTHPDLGEIPPAVFVPIAEEANLIGALGDWVLRHACAQAGEWPKTIRIAVNVSAAQLGNAGFASVVAQALAHAELAPDRLELEMTEAVFLADERLTTDMFAQLKMLGVRLALDDFGTGYSSLSCLQRAPFDKIKIDRTFIDGTEESGSRGAAIIAAVVSLAEALDIETTAEGIEMPDELAAMQRLGVRQVQGSIYAVAVPPEEVAAALQNGAWAIDPANPSEYRPERRSVVRQVGLIHEDHRYEVTMRNLSCSGCLVEGLVDVPVGTRFVVDFGEGQLAVAVVRRSAGTTQGLEFEQQLVDDGAGGLCTRSRVSPYALAEANLSAEDVQPDSGSPKCGQMPDALVKQPRFDQVDTTGSAIRMAANTG